MPHVHSFNDHGLCECGEGRCVDCKKTGKLSKFEIYVCRDDREARCPKCSEILAVIVAKEGMVNHQGRIYTREALIRLMVESRSDPAIISAWLDDKGVWFSFAEKKG